MYITAKVDYAVRAMRVLAVEDSRMIKAASIAEMEDMPLFSLQRVLLQLRRAGLLVSSRSKDAGYRLARPAAEITIAEVFNALEPLLEIHGVGPGPAEPSDHAPHLEEFWTALRASLRSVLDDITVEDLGRGVVPAEAGDLHHRVHAASVFSSTRATP